MKRRNFFTGMLSVSSLLLMACANQRSPRAASPESTVGLDIQNFSAADLQLPTGEPLLRFVAIADTGTGASGQYAVASAMAAHHQEQPYPLVVMAGDNIYPNGDMASIAQVFEEPYQALRDRGVHFQAILGNHDVRSNNGDGQVDYPDFQMHGQRYYTFTQGPVQFFALDTNTNADWERQFPWLQQELAQSTAPWKVVVGHHQIYASGIYGVNSSQWAARLKHLFAQHRVNLYINGHEHHYERTHAIDGTTYLVCGNGAKLRRVARSPWTAYSVSQLGFAVCEVFEDVLIVQGRDVQGQVFDQGIVPRWV